MGGFWRACNARSQAEKDAVPHRECMAARMADGREADGKLAGAAHARMTKLTRRPSTVDRRVGADGDASALRSFVRWHRELKFEPYPLILRGAACEFDTLLGQDLCR